MAKSLLKFALLAGLALGASGLPNLLGGLSSLSRGGAPAGLMPAGNDENSRELRRELAALPETIAELKALTRPREHPGAAGLSAAEREIMNDAAPKLRFKDNPLTRQFGLASGGEGEGEEMRVPGVTGEVLARLKTAEGPQFQSFGDFRGGLLRFSHARPAAMAYALWAAPAAALALSFLLFLLKRYTLSMLLTGWVFLLANFLIWCLSASVLLSSALTGQSLLAALPRELWLSPVIFLVVSAGMLRLADENYPFWNRTVSTLFAPIAASCLAAFWPLGAGYVKGLAGAGAAEGL